jgi:uncharacterized membrane protein
MNKKQQPDHSLEDERGMERLVFFSDAVFAIAITLLALEIRLPDVESMSNPELLQNLLAIWPKYLGYIISFLGIGNFWVVHHRQFQYIKKYDTRLLFINLIALMTVAFVPFPTAIISENGNRTGTIFYALTLSAVGFMSTAIWIYATFARRLVDADLPAATVRRGVLRTLSAPMVLLLSVGLAFIDPDLAKYSWVLIAPVVFLVK